MIKKLLVVACACALGVAQALTLAEARGKISACIANPKVMTETMKALSAEDQATFLADVNEAIGKMPGSNESRAAMYLNANKAALLGAEKGNVSTLAAETFATVPVEVLPMISDRFAADLFSRKADSTTNYTDEQFAKIGDTIMKKVVDRVASVENGDVRSTFAAAMVLKASGSPVSPVVRETVVNALPESQRENASKQLETALGENGNEASYEGLVENADPDASIPNLTVTLRLAGPQQLETVIAQVSQGIDLGNNFNSPTEYTYDFANFVEPHGYQGQTTH